MIFEAYLRIKAIDEEKAQGEQPSKGVAASPAIASCGLPPSTAPRTASAAQPSHERDSAQSALTSQEAHHLSNSPDPFEPSILSLTRRVCVLSLNDTPAFPLTRPFQPGLGNFSFLPPEVRAKIWQAHLDTDSSVSSTPNLLRPNQEIKTRSNRFFIFRTSKQLYDEMSEQFYHHRNLNIYFDQSLGCHDSPGPVWGTVFYTDINGSCTWRDFGYTDFSRFESISLSIQLPVNPPLESLYLNLRTLMENIKRFCALFSIQKSRAQKLVSWPTFKVSITFDQDNVRKPDSDGGRLRLRESLNFVAKLLDKIRVVDSIENIRFNLTSKLRWDCGYVNRVLYTGLHFPNKDKERAKRFIAGNAEYRNTNHAVLHASLQICPRQFGTGVTNAEIRRLVVMRNGNGRPGLQQSFCNGGWCLLNMPLQESSTV
ncbi:MAG: hypothetical protein Q9221_001038 [Calogaya cf. arnoldii]